MIGEHWSVRRGREVILLCRAGRGIDLIDSLKVDFKQVEF